MLCCAPTAHTALSYTAVYTCRYKAVRLASIHREQSKPGYSSLLYLVLPSLSASAHHQSQGTSPFLRGISHLRYPYKTNDRHKDFISHRIYTKGLVQATDQTIEQQPMIPDKGLVTCCVANPLPVAPCRRGPYPIPAQCWKLCSAAGCRRDQRQLFRRTCDHCTRNIVHCRAGHRCRADGYARPHGQPRLTVWNLW